MVNMTHTITLGWSKNEISWILGTSFAPKQNKKLTLFSAIAEEPVEIVFEQRFDNIKRLIETM